MFNSTSSKNKAEATVNKLLGSILPGNESAAKTGKKSSSPLSSTQLLSHQLSLAQDSSINLKKLKQKRNLAINKVSKQQKKFSKLTKYTIIKQKNQDETIIPQHAKYLNKLVKKNINLINKFSEIDDDEISQELQEIKSELVPSITNKTPKRIRKKKFITLKASSEAQFNEKVKKGWISMPGLTPGLAPVDYNESDED